MKKTARNVLIILIVIMVGSAVLALIGRISAKPKNVCTTTTGTIEVSGNTYYLVKTENSDDSYDDMIFCIDGTDYSACWSYNCRTYQFTFFKETYTVTFDYNDGETERVTQIVAGGSQLTEPDEPVRDGYTFDGWYYTVSGSEYIWDFDIRVIFDFEFTAHWSAVE